MQYVCEAETSRVVSRDEMMKGFEIEKGKYAVFTPTEVKSLEEASDGSCEIAEFVPQGSVDPLYYDKPAFLAPDKGASRAFALLSAAMERTHRVAIARYASRGKSRVALIRPEGAGLVLCDLLRAGEVRSVEALGIAPEKIDDKQLALAVRLIEQTAGTSYDAAAYPDDARERLMEAVARKTAGEPVFTPEKRAAPAGDLLAMLEASLKVAA